MAEKGVGGRVEFRGEPGAIDEGAHENEQRNDRKPVILRRVDGEPGGHAERAGHVGEQGKARDPDKAHGKCDGQSEEGEQQDGSEPDRGGEHGSGRFPRTRVRRVPPTVQGSEQRGDGGKG